MNIFLLIVVLFFVCFAIRSEIIEYNDAFVKCKPKTKDNLKIIKYKIENCLDYDLKTIKWRRVVISTILCIIIIFRKLPSSKEFLLYFFIIFITFYTSWQKYAKNYGVDALKYGKQNLRILGTKRTKIMNKINL